jgi:hypothetical protein
MRAVFHQGTLAKLQDSVMDMRAITAISVLVLVAGCGKREEVWDLTPGGANIPVHSMASSVALVDAQANRVIFASPADADKVDFSSIDIDHGFAASRATKGGDRLVVLTRGDVPRRRADDQKPGLTVIDDPSGEPETTRYELSDPLSGLEVDPTSEYAIVYAGAADSEFVQNPNELVLVKLTAPPSPTNPVPTTIRSFGGRPQGFTFTPELGLPGGKRRLLTVRTDRDVALIDLSAPDKPEITVKLTSGAETSAPASIAVSDGEPDDENDARLAVRLAQDENVILLDLLPTPPDKVATSPHSFLPVPNIVNVGGVATDIAFGRTDGGLRLLALVPSRNALVLVEPSTGVTTDVDLGAPFERISLVTDVVGETTNGSDVALLWSNSTPGIAIASLGVTVGKPYKSVERLSLEAPIASVLDVPAPNDHLKVLTSHDGTTFTVLDLVSRTASPLLTNIAGAAVASPDGDRLWLFSKGYSSLALVHLENLHPQNLILNYPIHGVFDVTRKDGGRALLALDTDGSMALTMFDAKAPSLDASTEYLGILFGDYQ